MTNRLLDIRTITDHGPDIHFTATEAEKQEIAKRFDIPKLLTLEVQGQFSLQDHIVFDGVLTAEAERICVSTLNPFVEKTSNSLHLLFDEAPNDTAPEEDDILPITKGKINLLEVFAEEYGLSLNPFPKSVSTYLDYHDQEDKTPNTNPFAVLKKLKK